MRSSLSLAQRSPLTVTLHATLSLTPPQPPHSAHANLPLTPTLTPSTPPLSLTQFRSRLPPFWEPRLEGGALSYVNTLFHHNAGPNRPQPCRGGILADDMVSRTHGNDNSGDH